MENNVYLLIGGNLGDRQLYLHKAKMMIASQIGHITALSQIYETQSWGYNDNDYLNQVVMCETELNPSEILKRIGYIESDLGRIRTGNGYNARTVDIDILLYGSQIVNTPSLTIPHPRMQLRRFVLTPMCDIGANIIHPILNKTMKELLQDCIDNCNVKIYLKK